MTGAPAGEAGDMEATLKKTAQLDLTASADPSALGTLYNDHATWLSGVLRRRYGADAADELTQDTFTALARFPPAEPLRDARAYLLHVARNLAKNRGRNSRRRATEPLDERADAVASMDASQLQAVLFRQIMLALPPKLRDVLVLNHVRGLTQLEIAKLLGISVKTVEKRMSKAVALCASAMRD